MVNPLNLNLLKSIMASRQGEPGSGPSSGGDFSRILAAAGEKADGKVLAQLANIMMLQSMSRLWSDNQGPSAGPSSGLFSGLPGLPPHWNKPVLPRESSGAAAALAAADKISPESENEESLASATRQKIDELISRAARRHGLEESLVRAVVTAESDFNPETVSKAGAMGLMQLMPETAADLGVADPFDPAQNIEGGARYLAMMFERFNGDREKALAAYNWGPSNVERGGGLPEETRNYLKKIERFQNLYSRGFNARA